MSYPRSSARNAERTDGSLSSMGRGSSSVAAAAGSAIAAVIGISWLSVARRGRGPSRLKERMGSAVREEDYIHRLSQNMTSLQSVQVVRGESVKPCSMHRPLQWSYGCKMYSQGGKL